MNRILLVEPDYHNKLPPLGLMKLSAYHKAQGDYVRFVKGKSSNIRAFGWDTIYIGTLFTFEMKRTLETIRFYSRSPGTPRVVVGGIFATLMPGVIEEATGATVVTGLLDEPGKLGLPGDAGIDRLTPDYSLLDEIDYEYPVSDAYFVHATRGCVRSCGFCAVPLIENRYQPYLSVADQVNAIEELYGPKQDLVIMDNNTVASARFDEIIDEILQVGFHAGAKLNRRQRTVDFNQGLDARLMTEAKMSRLAELCVKPLRIAFDDIALQSEYVQCIEWAASFGLKRLSNYVLFNSDDTPADFYERLRINIDLNSRLGTQIFSFPMRYSPIDRTDRTHIGEHWTWRYIRGVQCILNATHGVVGTRSEFFLRAFGANAEEFIRLISMPEPYILHRDQHEESEAREWRELYGRLSLEEMADFRARVLHERHPKHGSEYLLVSQLLACY